MLPAPALPGTALKCPQARPGAWGQRRAGRRRKALRSRRSHRASQRCDCHPAHPFEDSSGRGVRETAMARLAGADRAGPVCATSSRRLPPTPASTREPGRVDRRRAAACRQRRSPTSSTGRLRRGRTRVRVFRAVGAQRAEPSPERAPAGDLGRAARFPAVALGPDAAPRASTRAAGSARGRTSSRPTTCSARRCARRAATGTRRSRASSRRTPPRPPTRCGRSPAAELDRASRQPTSARPCSTAPSRPPMSSRRPWPRSPGVGTGAPGWTVRSGCPTSTRCGRPVRPGTRISACAHGRRRGGSEIGSRRRLARIVARKASTSRSCCPLTRRGRHDAAAVVDLTPAPRPASTACPPASARSRCPRRSCPWHEAHVCDEGRLPAVEVAEHDLLARAPPSGSPGRARCSFASANDDRRDGDEDDDEQRDLRECPDRAAVDTARSY